VGGLDQQTPGMGLARAADVPSERGLAPVRRTHRIQPEVGGEVGRARDPPDVADQAHQARHDGRPDARDRQQVAGLGVVHDPVNQHPLRT
jgi:hypothetical protein